MINHPCAPYPPKRLAARDIPGPARPSIPAGSGSFSSERTSPHERALISPVRVAPMTGPGLFIRSRTEIGVCCA
jgi:hypothetical protein